MRTNVCPVCGPVDPKVSSRYCMEHLRELLARCLEMPACPAARDLPVPDLGGRREPALAGRRAA